MGQSINRQFRAIAGLGLLLIIAIGMLAFVSTTTLVAEAQSVSETHEVLENVQALVANLTRAESAQRAYLLTGNQRDLNRYQIGIMTTRQSLQNLQVHTADDSEQQQRLQTLVPLLDRRLSQIRENIDRRETQGFVAALQAAQAESDILMPQIEDLLGAIENHEQSLLRVREAQTQADVRRTLTLIVVGSVLGLLPLAGAGIFIDRELTRRQRLETSLNLRDRAIASSRNGVFITDPHQPGNPLIYINPAFERLTGYTAADSPGSDGRFMAGAETDAVAQAELDAAIRGAHDVQVEMLTYRKDGSAFWSHLSVAPVYDASGKISNFVGILQDITTRRQTEEALREHEERLRILFEQSPSGIMLADPSDREIAWKIVDCNHVFGRMNGYERDELLGRSLLAIDPEDDDPVQRQNFLAYLRQHGTLTGEAVHRHKDGTLFPIEYSSSLLHIGGREMVLSTDRDITERKEAEARIRRQAEELHEKAALVELAQDAIISVDAAHNIQMFNQGAEKTFGYAAPEVLGKPLVMLLPERFRQVHPQRIAGFAATPETARRMGERSEIFGLRKDGHEFPAEASISKLAQGDAHVFTVILRDITERKLAAEELHKKAALLELAQDAIFDRGLDGTIRYWNRGAEVMYGWSREDALGKQKHILLHTQFPAPKEELIAILLREEHWEGELVHTRRDGTTLTVSSHWALQRDEDGNPGGVLEINSDITAQRAAEEALQEREATLNGIISASPDIITLLDPAGQLRWNSPAVSAVLGVTSMFEAETYSKGLIHSEDQPAVRRLLQTLLDGSVEEAQTRYRYAHADGHWVVLEGRARRTVDDEGQLGGVVIVSRDVTAQAELEGALRQAQEEADQANRAKSSFLANMSHEIRTPMNAIIGMTHLTLQTELSPKQRNYVHKINTAAQNLLGIINDVLDFSKIEAGKLSIEAIDFSLEDVLENVADLFMAKAQEKNLELLFDLEPGLPTALVGDPLRVSQILTNLISNALKFTEKGEIELSISRVEETEETAVLRFAVRDTGVGLTEAQRNKLFQAFSQADTSTTRKYGGTGLGLTIGKRLVEMMQGRIWVESEPGVGSSFIFTATFPKQKSAPGARNLRELAGMRVLVVDDNATVRAIFSRMLIASGFTVTTADSGTEALRLISRAREPFGLALVDWHPGDMNGIQLAQRIHDLPEGAEMPMIMISAPPDEAIQDQAAQAGISGFLSKALSPSTLLDSMLHVLGQDDHLPVAVRGSAKTIEARQLRGARVLLVEDNEINQEVAQEILEQAGLVVTVAADGKQGADLIRSAADAHDQYDAVLMDCQMPVLDGYAATRLVRQDQRCADLPIIAMTANAMAGDREQCLAAGMNDHVAKPIDVAELFSTLSRWVAPRGGGRPPGDDADQPTPGSAATDSSPAALVLPGVNVEEGLKRVGQNDKLYRRIVEKFRDSQAAMVGEIRAATQAGDYETATRMAHTLRGVAANLGAMALSGAAQQAEAALKAGDTSSLEQLLQAISVELDPLIAAIAALGGAPAPAASGVPPATAPAVSWGTIEPHLTRLHALIEEFDTDAVDAMEPLRPLLEGTPHAGALGAIESAIANYDFDAALASVDTLIAVLRDGSSGD